MNFNEYNFLCHHGILGMKWGIRRYQNPDGSLTSAGRARYGGEKAEKYRAKLLRKAHKMNKYGEYDRAIKKISSASNDEIAKELANRNRKSKKTGLYSSAGAGVAAFAGNVAQVQAANANGTTVAQLSDVPLTMVVGYFAGKGISKLNYSKNLINRYNMTSAKSTSKQTEGKRSVSASMQGEKRAKAEYEPKVKELFKKYPGLYEDFGGPDQIDDWEMFEMVVDDYKKKR